VTPLLPGPAIRPVDVPGREAETWELASFAAGDRSAEGRVRIVLGEPGSGKSTLLSALATHEGLRPISLSPATLLHPVDFSSYDVALVDDIDVLARDALDSFLYASRRLPPHLRVIATGDVSLLPLVSHAGVGVTVLDPLSPDGASRLLDASAPGAIADHVRVRLVADAAGNPRALLDLLAALDADTRRGSRRLPDPLPLSRPAAEYWLRGAADRDDTLGLAALAILGEARPAWVGRAADALGVAAPLDRWEEERLVIHERGLIRFRSRIVRSAALAMVKVDDRTRLQRAVVGALDDGVPHDQLVRLRADLAETDDALAAELEAAAAALARRDGPGAVADVLERAAELSSAQSDAASRFVRAAYAAWQAGWGVRAQTLLARARPIPDQGDVQGTAALVAGGLALGAGDADAATEELLRGARAAGSTDHQLALDPLARAAGAAIWTGDPAIVDRAVRGLPEHATDTAYGRVVAGTVRAAAGMLRGDHAAAASLREELGASSAALVRPRQLVFAAEAAGMLGDDDASLLFLHRASRAMQGTAPQAEAGFTFELLSYVNAWQGRVDAASAAADAGLDMARRLGERTDGPFQLGMLVHLAALRGDEDECNALAERATLAAGGVEPPTVAWARGRAALSAGDHARALAFLEPLTRGTSRNTLVALYATPDIVEAAAELHAWTVADPLLEEFAAWAAGGSPWARAVEPRLRALRATDREALDLFLLAVDAPHGTPRPFDDARTRLLLGRALRRERRRSDARDHLRQAAAAFEHLGARAWAARASGELRASGESSPLEAAAQWDTLTPQEQRIAELIGSGVSNRVAADQLHLSARTIEYHLSKIYVKLGISSRTQLARLLGAGPSSR
jgi:DNA-binding CsgD family transcriptional regulator